MTDDTLTEIIRMATFAADTEMLDRRHRTTAEMVGAVVDRAIRAAVDNKVLLVASDADQRLADGFIFRFAGGDHG